MNEQHTWFSSFVSTKRKRKHTKRLLAEPLEDRRLLALMHNLEMPLDTNRDSSVTAADALVVVNEMAGRQSSKQDVVAGYLPDVDGNGDVTPLDALLVINHLNEDGEDDDSPTTSSQTAVSNQNDVAGRGVSTLFISAVPLGEALTRPVSARGSSLTILDGSDWGAIVAGDEIVLAGAADNSGNVGDGRYTVSSVVGPTLTLASPLGLVNFFGFVDVHRVIDSVSTGSDFLLGIFAEDLVEDGPFAIYTDILFDPALASATGLDTTGSPFPESPTENFRFNSFVNGKSGDFQTTPGLVDEAGAFRPAGRGLGAGSHLVFAVNMRAGTQSGTLRLDLRPAGIIEGEDPDGPDFPSNLPRHDVLVNGSNVPVCQEIRLRFLPNDTPPCTGMAAYVGATLEITGAPAVTTEVSLSGGTLTITDIAGGDSDDELELSYAGGTYTLTDRGGLAITTAVAGSTGDGTSTVTFPDTDVTSIVFDTLAGNDTLIVHSLQASLPDGFAVNDGAGDDSFTLDGAINTGAGDVSIAASLGVFLNPAAGISTTGGDITLKTDRPTIGASLQGAANLVIAPDSPATTIGLGGGAGTLNLDDSELSLLQDGFSSITIGDPVSGTGTVQIDTATFVDPISIAGGTIHDAAATDIDAGANRVTLVGNVSPGESPGVLNVLGDFAFGVGSTFEAEITGALPGTHHDQIAVVGSVDINHATLNVDDAGFAAAGDELFVLIDNDGADPVTGTFNGLPEGAHVAVGGDVFELSYSGGDGNDVVLGRACSFLVTRTDDSGFETLRRAIECSNDMAGADTITFSIPGAGPHTIQPNSALPVITDPVTIDGTSQPDFASTPVIEIDGSHAGAGVHGLQIDSGGSTVRGLAVNRFSLSGIVLAFGGGNTIQQNMIGTDPAGTIAQGNNSHGIVIFDSPNNIIGGVEPNAGNVLSGNRLHGALISRGGSTGNQVLGNRIGVAADGVTPLGNSRMGVRIDQTASNNHIGGTNSNAGNVIANQGSAGVAVVGNSTGNAIRRNSVFDNGTLGIDLNFDGVTPNDVTPGSEDADAGPNQLQNKPVLSMATLVGTELDLAVVVPSATAHAAYPLTLELFTPDASGMEGKTFLTSVPYDVPAPPTMLWTTLDVTGLGLTIGSRIVATVTDLAGNTSEFSTPVTVTANDPGLLTTSENFTFDNGATFHARVTGAAPGMRHDQIAVTGTVDLGNATLTIDDAGFMAVGDEQFVLIDNDGADPVSGTFNGLPEGSRVTVGDEVFGLSYAAGDGNDVVLGRACSFLVTRTGDDGFGTLRRAIECSNDTPGTDTITFDIPGTGPHTIRPNSALPVVTDAVVIDGTSEPDFDGTPVVEIDGSNAGAAVHGLQIDSGGSTVRGLAVNRFSFSGIVLAFGGGNTIQQNMVGTDPTGTVALGNRSHGVVIFDSPNNMIGGADPGDRNIISGNHLHGMQLTRAGSTGNVVQGNRIGVAADGMAPLGNGRMGVRIDRTASNNTIGGALENEGNIIAHQAGTGVAIIGNSTGNAVRRNSIFANGGLGIDLDFDGVTPNDLLPADEDADTGPNQRQNTPIVFDAKLSGADLEVNFAVPSAAANSAYPLTVELFIADAAGQEGETFLAAQTYALLPPPTIPTITIDVAGLGISGNTQLVATATDSAGNTSEFSPPVTVSAALRAAGSAVLAADEPDVALLNAGLQPVVDAAIVRWQAAEGEANQLSLPSSDGVSPARLGGAYVGLTANTIQLDNGAAGRGRLMAPTPLDDSEFAERQSNSVGAAKWMDLLTEVMHGVGHVSALDEQLEEILAEDVIFAWLGPG